MQIYFLWSFLFNVVLEVLASVRGQEKRYKDWIGRNKTALWTDEMFIYIENSKQSIKKLLKLKVCLASLQDTMQYTSYQQLEIEVKMPFKI